MLRKWGLVLVSIALVLGSACNPPEDADEGLDPALDGKPQTRVVAGRLKVDVTGDAELHFDDQASITILVLRSHAKELRVLSVGIKEFRNSKPLEQFRIAFDIQGQYTGPGKFKIPATTAQFSTVAPADGQLDLSNMFIIIANVRDDSKQPVAGNVVDARNFNLPFTGCTVEVERNEESGKMVCDEVKDEKKEKTIRVEMSWDLD